MSNTAKTTRETFSGRKAFILAAIGSAVGLGNIWRFPYTAYENGGGAFIVPYIIALLTAGIPLLFLDYAIGHRHRGSAPLAFDVCIRILKFSVGGKCWLMSLSASIMRWCSAGLRVIPIFLSMMLGAKNR